MAKKLVIVESPTKAKILKKILGRGYAVESSTGHIRDLPEKKDHLSAAQQKLPHARLGIDVENDFKPLYCSSPTKKKKLTKLKGLIEAETELFLATDEDREGEAIAWHLNDVLNPKGKLKATRVVFHEITPGAILSAFEKPRELDMNMVEAQQSRRILDRLVGFRLSPLLWKKIRFGLSAGRGQSAAVRIIMDRELEIRAFVPEEYWSITAKFSRSNVDFEAPLTKKDGKKFVPSNQEEADAVMAVVKGAGQQFVVGPLETKTVRRNPSPPFITSTLQQEASRKLGFSVKKTMQLAQKLYEGVDLKGEGGATGLITYMRTDSVNLSKTALEQAHAVLGEFYGSEYQLPEPRVFKSKAKGAQEAHEAIRPTEMFRKPESVKEFLDADMLKLYDLIWKRTLATQAPRAEFKAVSTDLGVGDYGFRATGQTLTFPGFIRIYVEGSDNPESALEDRDKLLPALSEGERLQSHDVDPKQHFTKPPARYTEASLVRKMEEEGIGRPSTYAPTISTVISRGYVMMDNKVLSPTDTAEVVNNLLVQHFPDVVNLQFTANMENDLDVIAEGKKKWVPFLREFYTPFDALVGEKDKSIKKEDVVNEATDEICELCGKPMVIKLGRMGKFLSCSDYPTCKHAEPIGEESEEVKALKEKFKDAVCEKCGASMEVKSSRYGEFLGCSAYPKCKTTEPIVKSTGVTCPCCLKHEMVEKKGGKGRSSVFYGCQGYPDCDYLSRYKPLSGPKDGEDRLGFYIEKGGEQVFFDFDPEAWEKQRQRNAARKKKKEEVVEK
jgi:DNA topoisomerase-1